MEELVILFIIAIIIGAFLGGRTFGGTVRKGCGCMIWVVLIIAALAAFAFWMSVSTSESGDEEAVKTETATRIERIQMDYYPNSTRFGHPLLTLAPCA